jgi:hypothetical protein
MAWVYWKELLRDGILLSNLSYPRENPKARTLVGLADVMLQPGN